MMRSSSVTKCMLFLSGILLACGLMEIALRIHNPLPFSNRFGEVELPANRTYRYRSNGTETVLHYNSLGFRGPELPERTSLYKIITMGGSTTECRALTEGSTWPDILEKNLKNENIWINNAGSSGHSTHAHFLLYHEYVKKLEPDLILLLVGINDMGREDLLDPNYSFHKEYGHFLKKSHLIHTLYNIYRLYRVVPLNPTTTSFSLSEMPAAKSFPSNKEQEVYEDHKRTYIPAYKFRLLKFIKALDRKKTKLILLTQPLLYGNTVDPTTGIHLGDRLLRGKNFDATNFYSFPGPIPSKVYWNTLKLYNVATKEVGDILNVKVIDLASAMPKDSKYFYDSMHYTEQGAKFIGNYLADALLEEKMLNDK